MAQKNANRLARLMGLGLLALAASGCTEHVFESILAIQTRTVVIPKRIDIDRAADILFVIDNSGSMAEEQENLGKNASSSQDPRSECNADAFDRLRTYVRNNRNLRQDEWSSEYTQIFDECGFIERLQLFDNKFHIGVISTDMNNCDKPQASSPRPGSVPQLGCLQSSEQDPNLTVLRWDTPNLAEKFYNIVTNLRTSGSAYEKGLESAKHFLTQDHSVADSSQCALSRNCSGDYEEFWRDTEVNAAGDEVETKLVIIFLTDEEDCSHDGSIDENEYGTTELCYTKPEVLRPVEGYVRFFRSLKPRAELISVAVIAGLYGDDEGMFPSGCVLNGSTTSNECDPSKGNSVATCDTCWQGQPVCPCHPAMSCEGQSFADTNCCQADPAKRYYDVAKGMADAKAAFKLDTICSDNYMDTMIGIANLVNEPGSVLLSETPTDPRAIVVKITGSRWDDEWVNVPRYDEASGQPAEGGWALVENNTRIKFFNEWVPEPGDQVQVMFLGNQD